MVFHSPSIMKAMASMISPTGNSLIPITLLIFLNLLGGTATSPYRECAAELVEFSPCLPVISAPPKNVTAAVFLKCCDAMTFLFNRTGGNESCICHLLRHPKSVHLNISRVLFSSSVCLANTTRSLECSSVEFGTEFNAIRKCDLKLVINGSCVSKQEECCWNLCRKHIPYGKIVDVGYKVINGSLMCYCHVIYQDKSDSCVIMLNF